MAQQLTNPISIHEYSGSIPGLDQWVKDLLRAVVQVEDAARVLRCCGCGIDQQPQLGFDSQPGNLHMPWMSTPPKKKLRGTESLADILSYFIEKNAFWSSHRSQAETIQIGTIRLQVQSLASLSGLRIHCCRELWCRSQLWLRSCVFVAVAQAGGCKSNQTPNLGTSICSGCSPKKTKRKKKGVL